MKIIYPSVILMTDGRSGEELLQRIENYGRTCYKSEDKITSTSYIPFIKSIMKRGHFSVIEHEKATVRVICDRGVTHEIVRHRIGSYSQESTRYCNYSGKDMEFIRPCFFNDDTVSDDTMSDKYKNIVWQNAMREAEDRYNKLIEAGATPQEARGVLPNSLKTEIVITYNLREWRHFFELRCDKASHPQMREIALITLNLLSNHIPIIFDDLKEKYLRENEEIT